MTGLPPTQPPAWNRLEDQVIGGGRGTDTHTEVDLPVRGDIEIGNRKHLLLLRAARRKISDPAEVAVILETRADDSGEGVADFETAHRLLEILRIPGKVAGVSG